MDENLIYMILGIIATIIVGYYGIKYTSKQKNKTSLLYFENSCISLFKSVVRDLDELEIRYKGTTVTENLISYKGTFFNSGNVDIDKNLIHKPLNIILPENYEWKKVKIIDKSEGINISFTEQPDKLEFSWDILKENEFFTFDSVIEYKPIQNSDSKFENWKITSNLSNKIDFTQRITNLKSIDKEFIPTKPKSILKQVILSLYLFAFAIFGLYLSAGQFVFPDFKTIYEVKIDSTYSYVTLENENENLMNLINLEGDKIKELSVNEINHNILTGKIKTQKDDLSYWGLIGGGILAALVLFILITITNNYISDKNLYNKINQIADKYDSGGIKDISLPPKLNLPFD
jgi:hypothetical protein